MTRPVSSWGFHCLSQSRVFTILLSQFLLMILIFVSGTAFCASVEHEFHLNNDFSVVCNDVSGAGDHQSSLTEGVHFLNEMVFYGDGRRGDWSYNYRLGGKATDDDRNDLRRFSLTGLHGRLTNGTHTLNLGDTYDPISQYTINTVVKGGSYHYESHNRFPDITLLYGIAYPRWDNFWDVETVERHAMGVRVHKSLNDEFSVAVNFARTDDHKKIANQVLYDINTLSLNWEYFALSGLTLRGESAVADSAMEMNGMGTDSRTGSAHKIEVIRDGEHSRMAFEYERVSPDYITVLGSAIFDREKFKAQWRYIPVENYTWNFGFLWYRDNLNGDLEATTNNFVPEVGVERRRLLERENSVANLSYRFKRSISDIINNSDHFINLGYRDRFGIVNSSTNLGVTIYDTNGIRKDNEYIYGTTLDTRHDFGEVILKPSFHLGGWTLDNELNDEQDRIWDYSLGLGLDVPSIELTSTLRAGMHRLQKEEEDDLAKTFGSLKVYYRPDFMKSWMQNSRLFLNAFVNDYDYASKARDFRENSVSVGLNVQL